MRTLGTISTMCALILAVGCDDSRGGEDAGGGIVLMDAGPGMMGTDAGPGMMGTDAGPGMMMGGACAEPLPDLRDIAMDPMAPPDLLPRCAADTQTCIDDALTAMDIMALQACLTGDTTPGVDIGGGQTLTCEFCFNVQFNKCVDAACTSQFADLRCCAEAAGCADINSCPACMAESDALSSCSMGSVSIPGCATYTDACFP